MEILLRLKAWQIFLMTFGVIFLAIGLVVAMSFMETIDLTLATRVSTMLVLVGATIANVWLYMIATVFHGKFSEQMTVGLTIFKACFWFIIVYQFASLIFFPILRMEEGPIDRALTIMSYICSLYMSYRVAKILQASEQQKTLAFPTGDFFAFLFYPIGVWFLQPRINNLFDGGLPEIDPDAPLDQSIR